MNSLAIKKELVPIGEKNSVTLELNCGHTITEKLPATTTEESVRRMVNSGLLFIFCPICREDKVKIVDFEIN